jgi:hypothetical protein
MLFVADTPTATAIPTTSSSSVLPTNAPSISQHKYGNIPFTREPPLVVNPEAQRQSRQLPTAWCTGAF